MPEENPKNAAEKEKRPDESEPDEPDEPRTAPFGWVSLLIIVALVVGTWFLIQKLSADAKMQDCVQSGRRNCAPIDDTRP